MTGHYEQEPEVVGDWIPQPNQTFLFATVSDPEITIYKEPDSYHYPLRVDVPHLWTQSDLDAAMASVYSHTDTPGHFGLPGAMQVTIDYGFQGAPGTYAGREAQIFIAYAEETATYAAQVDNWSDYTIPPEFQPYYPALPDGRHPYRLEYDQPTTQVLDATWSWSGESEARAGHEGFVTEAPDGSYETRVEINGTVVLAKGLADRHTADSGSVSLDADNDSVFTVYVYGTGSLTIPADYESFAGGWYHLLGQITSTVRIPSVRYLYPGLWVWVEDPDALYYSGPPRRQFPRDDGLAGGVPRVWPPPQSQQEGISLTGYL